MAQKQSATIGKDALFAALSDKNAGCPFSDEQLNALIEKELSKPADEMDVDKTDACYCLLERRHSPFSGRQLAKSERKSRARFKRFMKQHRALEAERKRLSLRPLAVAALIVLLIGGPALYVSRSYRVFTSPDQQQYVVVGIQKNEMGEARAAIHKTVTNNTYHLNNVDEIASLLGYQIQLPTNIPSKYALTEITVSRSQQDDTVQIEYSSGNDSIFIDITYYEDRSGSSTSYEQDKQGQQFILDNGEFVYISTNVQSTWGLYQSNNLDYLIDGTALDERSILSLFNSMKK